MHEVHDVACLKQNVLSGGMLEVLCVTMDTYEIKNKKFIAQPQDHLYFTCMVQIIGLQRNM